MDTLALRNGHRLRKHQERAIKWVADKRREAIQHARLRVPKPRGFILNIEMGLGKTLIALYCIMVSKLCRSAPSLYLCSKSTIGTVVGECQKFFGTRLGTCILSPDTLRDSKVHSTAVFLQHCDIVFATFGTVVRLRRTLRSEPAIAKAPNAQPKRVRAESETRSIASVLYNRVWEWNMVDESQILISGRTQLFQAVSALKSHWRMCLSGTPTQESNVDLQSQLRFCGLEISRSRLRTGETPPNLLRISIKDTDTRMPELRYHTHKLKFSDLEREEYNRAYRTIGDSVRGRLPVFTRLRRICSGGNEQPQRQSGHGPRNITKLNFILEVLHRVVRAKQSALVFSSFSSTLKTLGSLCDARGIPFSALVGSMDAAQRQKQVHMFQNNTRPVFLLGLQSGCTGLNLYRASHVIFTEPDWSFSKTRQAICRAYRPGQTHIVHVWFPTIQDSIETLVLQRLKTNPIQVERDSLKMGDSQNDVEMMREIAELTSSMGGSCTLFER